jgi:hypothetical protein
VNVSSLVTLKGGTVVPLAAFRLILDLEGRGCTITSDGEELIISPRRLLTDEDRLAIRQWRQPLIDLAQYVAPSI